VDEDLLRRGLIFMPLRRAIAEHEALVREHLFERMPDLGSEKYQALHVAMFSDGVFVHVPRGMEISLPLAALHESKAGTPVLPHSLVVADEGASVDFFEIFRSQDNAPKTFVCAATDLLAKRDARIRRRTVQDWNRDSLAFHLDCSTAGDSSLVDVIGINLGASHLRGEQHGRISGRGADVRMHSLCLATGSQQMDQRTLQTHDAPDGKSDLLYKNVLLDEARTIFSGLIKVSPDAQRTDAYQTNRNLLLSNEAEANSLPGLEILANDVKCSHGMSSSQLDPDQLYYLAARGIDKRSAQRLLVFGFFEEVLEKIGSEPLAEYIRGILQSRFGR
jgi:Fe-S cluster assembly protein SufD